MTDTTTTQPAIRPFSFTASDEGLTELRRRIAATRWPAAKSARMADSGDPYMLIVCWWCEFPALPPPQNEKSIHLTGWPRGVLAPAKTPDL
jgi:hypothetical protein